MSDDAPNDSLRGQEITAVFEVLEVKKLELPKLTHELLDELGGFEYEGELRDAISRGPEAAARLSPAAAGPAADHRRADRRRPTGSCRPICCAGRAGASWSGPCWSCGAAASATQEIRAYENDLRQNSLTSTAKALKEHFILERIAEEENIEAEARRLRSGEIELIAAQSGESVAPRAGPVGKQGLMDALRNQIIERKVIDLVLEHAKFKDVPLKPEGTETEAIEQTAGGEDESEIPEAKHAGEAEPLRTAKERE